MSKGSHRRPGDAQAYRESWDRIFGTPAPCGPTEDERGVIIQRPLRLVNVRPKDPERSTI